MAKKKVEGITIPGTKVKAPPWALAAVGGGVLAVLFLMKDSAGGESESGVSFGFFAEEVAQRMDDERRIFAGAIEDINDKLVEMRDQRIEDKKLPGEKRPLITTSGVQRRRSITTPGDQRRRSITTPGDQRPSSRKSERGNGETWQYETVPYVPEILDLPGSGLDIKLNRQQQAEADRMNAITAGYASGQVIGTVGGTPVVKSQISTRSDESLKAETDRWTAQAVYYGAKIGDPSPVPKVTAKSSSAAKTTAAIQERFNKIQAARLAAAAKKSSGRQEL